ncbi:MAG: GTPase Era [Bacteroidia bacterium]
MSFKSGFVSIIGKPNVGKSTLLNAFLGQKISIITPKAQTTRHRIKGILNNPQYQVVFSDTPGIIEPKYKLQGSMMKFVNESLQDCDLVLFVTDLDSRNKEDALIEKLNLINTPIICVINKVDESTNHGIESEVNFWKEKVPTLKEIIPVSATNNFNINVLLNRILDYLPEGPPFFTDDQITDKSERFVASEIIREKILLRYKEEIPYSVQVEIESFKDEPHLLSISAIIYVMRTSQRQILIGKEGVAIKQLGIAARRSLEQFFGKKVFLKTFVKVKEDWRNNNKLLKEWGYEEQ